jgi:hypothetical protein
MGLLNIFKGQLAQVIEWKSPEPEQLWYRFPSKLDEIKDASKLIVAPGQGALLVYDGKVVEVITEPGSFLLRTDNHPFVTTLVRLHQGMESEHKLQIYFFRTSHVTNVYWGTSTPIKLMDNVYKVPVEMGMNGTYSFRISDPQHFFVNYIGTNSEGYDLEPLREIFLERTYQATAAIIHEGGYPYIEVDAHLAELSGKLCEYITPIFAELGLELTDVRVSGTQFDEGTLRRIARVSDVTAETRAAAEAGLSYEEMQRLQALRDAARNEGGLAGAGVQMGVGLELGRKITGSAAASSSGVESEHIERLRKLKVLLDEGIITQEDYNIKKQELLEEL